jgi:hypothetical protein
MEGVRRDMRIVCGWGGVGVGVEGGMEGMRDGGVGWIFVEDEAGVPAAVGVRVKRRR